MTEFEIILLINENANRLWTIMQFWASVSFGLIIVAHIAVKKLHLAMVLVLSFLYIGFSLFALSMLKLISGVSDGYLMDLEVIVQSGKDLSHAGKILVSNNVDGGTLLLITMTFLGTFLSSITFLWYSYFSKRNSGALVQEKDRETSD